MSKTTAVSARGHAEAIFDELPALGATVSVDSQADFLETNSEYSASLMRNRCRETTAGNTDGAFESLNPEIIITARLQPG